MNTLVQNIVIVFCISIFVLIIIAVVYVLHKMFVKKITLYLFESGKVNKAIDILLATKDKDEQIKRLAKAGIHDADVVAMANDRILNSKLKGAKNGKEPTKRADRREDQANDARSTGRGKWWKFGRTEPEPARKLPEPPEPDFDSRRADETIQPADNNNEGFRTIESFDYTADGIVEQEPKRDSRFK